MLGIVTSLVNCQDYPLQTSNYLRVQQSWRSFFFSLRSRAVNFIDLTLDRAMTRQVSTNDNVKCINISGVRTNEYKSELLVFQEGA